jgi:thiol-disulfide isomerase/thioredoxin
MTIGRCCFLALTAWFWSGRPALAEVTDTPVQDSAESSVAAKAARPSWQHDIGEAMKQAAVEGKTILMEFTGSDWCVWCKRLSDEVFSNPDFQSWANDQLILVELDFPTDSSKLPENIRLQNDQWLKKMQVDGFPTVMLVDEQGRPFARTGYREGGPSEYIQHLQELLQLRSLRDAAFKLADKAEGAQKARFLDEALSTIDQRIAGLHYVDTIEQIQELGGAELKEKYTRLKEMSVGGAESAGIVREDWMSDPFGFLSADMHTASQHLEAVDTEPPVVEYHPRIQDRLAKLIELMSKTSPSGAASQSGRNPRNPASQSTLRKGEGGIGDLRDPDQARREWAALSPKQREKILQSKTEGFPADLDDVLSDYFRAVAREGTGPPTEEVENK